MPRTASPSNGSGANCAPGARALWRRGRLRLTLAAHEQKSPGPCLFRAGELGSLRERFRLLPDGRRGHGRRHRQPFVLAAVALDDDDLLAVIRGYGDASENGTPHRRDVSLGQDACGVSERGAAQMLAPLRNRALGWCELAQARGDARPRLQVLRAANAVRPGPGLGRR